MKSNGYPDASVGLTCEKPMARCNGQMQRAPPFGLSRLATTFMNNPRSPNGSGESMCQCTKVPLTRFETRKYQTRIPHASAAMARSSTGSLSLWLATAASR